jgi:tetratricopeptide (TPR) repeat protein
MRAAGWVFLLCLPSAALADVPPAQDLASLQRPSRPMIEVAQQHYRAGERFFRDGEFDAAIVEFEAAFKLSGEPDMVYNLSRTCEKAGRLKEAIEYAARYQSLVVGSDEEERARRRVEFLRGRYSVEQAQPKPPEQPPAKPAETTPPSPAPAAQARQPPDPTQTAPSAPPSPPPPSKARKVPPGAIGLLAGGGALALAGVGLLAGAWATGNQARADGTAYADWIALNDKGSALNTGGIVLSVVGGALAVGGAVWAIVPSRNRQVQQEIAE